MIYFVIFAHQSIISLLEATKQFNSVEISPSFLVSNDTIQVRFDFEFYFEGIRRQEFIK